MRIVSGFARSALCVGGVLSFGLAHASGAGFFVDAGVGATNPDGDSGSDTAYRVGLGYRWAVGEQAHLGLHAGYVDLGTVATGSVTTIGGSGSFTRSIDVDGRLATVGADARFALAPQWHVDVRGGYLRGHLHANVPRVLIGGDDPNGWTAGVGVGYDINDHWTADLGYDQYRLNVSDNHFDVGVAGAGLEYRF